MADRIICSNPNCGFKGEATPVSRGSTVLFFLLLLVGILPGLLYYIFAGGWDNYCPRCNLNLGKAQSGPEGARSPVLVIFVALLLFGLVGAIYFLPDAPGIGRP